MLIKVKVSDKQKSQQKTHHTKRCSLLGQCVTADKNKFEGIISWISYILYIISYISPHCGQTLTGKEIEIDIEPTDKVDRIKERVEEKEGIPPQQQRLIFSGKQM